MINALKMPSKTLPSGYNTGPKTSTTDKCCFCRLCHDDLSTKRGKRAIMIKIIILAIIPIITLVIQGAVIVSKDIRYMDIENTAEDNVKLSVYLGSLVHNLQMEKDMSTFYLTTRDPIVYSDLVTYRRKTEKSITALNKWISLDTPSHFRSKALFTAQLQERRLEVDSLNISSDDIIKAYSTDHELILDSIGTIIREADFGQAKKWQPLVAYHMILLSKEQAGLERAIGSIYYGTGKLTSKELLWYKEKKTLGESYLNRSMQYSLFFKNYIQIHVTSSQVGSTILRMRDEILDNNDTVASVDAGVIWFDNMTAYINILQEIQEYLAQDIINILEDHISELQKDLTFNIVEMMFALLLFPVTMVFVYRLTSKLHQFADSLSAKTHALDKERQRSEQLLNQMLPAAIAQRMMKKLTIVPEHYDPVSIYFSDIVGFTNICSQSTPMEVIYMMNSLYIMMDERLEAYDVYKVETIGDAYMVVAGLPVVSKNRSRHAVEIAALALDILKSVSRAIVPHMPDKRWQIRIGINTGSVVAGVVGTKMPRYCLFGDTVNVASRMESTSKPGMIQLSSSTREALLRYPEIRVTPRGEMSIKGKGQMTTYWLIGMSDEFRLSSSPQFCVT